MVLAASILLKKEIRIVSSISTKILSFKPPPNMGLTISTSPLWLGHFHEFHYVATAPSPI